MVGWKESMRIPLAAALLALVGGCAVMEKQVTEPEVRVADVRVVAMSLADAQIAVDLDVQNPNTFGLSMAGLSYRLALQDKPLLDGTVDEAVEVAANGTSRVTLPFTVRFEAVFGSVRDLAEAKSLGYEIAGRADFGWVSLPYAKRGTFRLPELPEISVRRLKIDKLDLEGVDLALGIEVMNANDFPVRFEDMAYELTIAGSPLLKGHSAQAISVAPNGSTVLDLALSLEYSELGALVQKLRGAGSLPIEFRSRVTSPGRTDEVVIPYAWTGEVPLRR